MKIILLVAILLSSFSIFSDKVFVKNNTRYLTTKIWASAGIQKNVAVPYGNITSLEAPGIKFFQIGANLISNYRVKPFMSNSINDGDKFEITADASGNFGIIPMK